MNAASPYRAPSTKPTSTLSVPVFSLPRGLLVVFAVIFFVPLGMHVFLWSRVTTVHCERQPSQHISCEIDEVSAALSDHTQQLATGALAAEVRGKTMRSRGDMWIVLVGARAETPLTSGFNGDKTGQAAAAAKLNAFLLDSQAASVTVSFGSRSRTAWIFGILDAFMVLLLYPLLGQRLKVTANRARDALDFHRRAWPFPGSRAQMVCSRFARFEVEHLQKGRYRLVAMTKDGQTLPVSGSLAAGSLLEKTVERLNRWAAAELPSAVSPDAEA